MEIMLALLWLLGVVVLAGRWQPCAGRDGAVSDSRLDRMVSGYRIRLGPWKRLCGIDYSLARGKTRRYR